MKKIALILFFLIFVLPAAGQTSITAEFEAEITTFIRDSVLAGQNLPGIAIAISSNQETIYEAYFGHADIEQNVPVTADTKFRIASISKPLTADAVVQLVDQNILDVDVPIQDYIDWFPVKRAPITLRLLGAHMAGIRSYRGGEFMISAHYDSVRDGIKIFENDTLIFEPGSKYSYSSYGFNLISMIVEAGGKKPFLNVMQDLVFDPLNMRNTMADQVYDIIPNRARFYVHDENDQIINAPFVDNSYKWAGGGFLSTTSDLLKFAHAHLPESEYLSAQAREILFTPHLDSAGGSANYGFGWRVSENHIEHTGGAMGGTSILLINPEKQLCMIVMINISGADLPPFRKVFEQFENL